MRKLTVATLALAALLLSGCVPASPPATQAPTPSPTPVFASEADALAAAEAAYAAYLKVSDEVTADGGSMPERVKPFVTEEQYQVELNGFGIYSSKGWRTVGSSAFTSTELQRYTDSGAGSAEVVVYVCSDLSGLRILDAQGADVTPANLPTHQTLQVSLETNSALMLVLSGTEIWESKSSC